MLLGLINLGSSSAFLAFVSVGVVSLAVSYGIPIAISLFHRRREVNAARWTMGRAIGPVVNIVAIAFILFELVLFSMPTALPVTAASMNYAIVVFVGFMALSAVWYGVYARKGLCITGFLIGISLVSRRRTRRSLNIPSIAPLYDFAANQVLMSSIQGASGIRWPHGRLVIKKYR